MTFQTGASHDQSYSDMLPLNVTAINERSPSYKGASTSTKVQNPIGGLPRLPSPQHGNRRCDFSFMTARIWAQSVVMGVSIWSGQTALILMPFCVVIYIWVFVTYQMRPG